MDDEQVWETKIKQFYFIIKNKIEFYRSFRFPDEATIEKLEKILEIISEIDSYETLFLKLKKLSDMSKKDNYFNEYYTVFMLIHVDSEEIN